MPKKAQQPKCHICNDQLSKYRCPQCPVRYCSVTCFKQHKATTHADVSATKDEPPDAGAPVPSGVAGAVQSDGSAETENANRQIEAGSSNLALDPSADHVSGGKDAASSLKPLSELLWPPEPDPSIFTDPLRKEDPKPLRHEELLRIATSPQLRYLLTATNLPRILRILDSLPTPSARSATLSRLLGLDPASLSKPDNPMLSQRDSPPPLGELLDALSGQDGEQEDAGGRAWDEQGWWLYSKSLSRSQGNVKDEVTERIWIGEEEKKIMRLFAGVVCKEIDEGEQEDDLGWGSGGLQWEI